MNQNTDYKTELIKNGAISFVPSGNSMWPIIKNRKSSVIVKLKESRLKKYDVAFFNRANGVFVLHRVLSVTDDGYIVCGDSQTQLEQVKEEQVFGVLMGYYSGKRYIESNDVKYLKKVDKWYNNKLRKIILKFFHKWIYIKTGCKKFFGKSRVNDDE